MKRKSRSGRKKEPFEDRAAEKAISQSSDSEILTLEWTREARLAIFPKRGFPYEGYTPPRESRILLQKMRKLYQSNEHELRPDLAGETCRRLMEAVALFMKSGSESLDVSAQAATAVLLGINEERGYIQERVPPAWIADYWVALGGCAFAVKVMVSTFRFGISHNAGYFDSGSEFGDAPPCYTWLSPEQGHAPLFEEGNGSLPFTIRFHLAATADEDFEAVRTWADETRRAQPLIVRCALSCAFPDEEEWCVEDLRECLKKAERGKSFPGFGKPLIASLKDPDLIRALLKAIEITERELLHAPTLLDNLGPEAAFPILCSLLEAVPPSYLPGTAEARRICANAIASIKGRAVAGFFIPWCTDKDISSIASGYIKKYPQLSHIPLLNWSRAGKAHAGHIDVLLANVERIIHEDNARSARKKDRRPSGQVEITNDFMPTALREESREGFSQMPGFWDVRALSCPRLSKGNMEIPNVAMERLGRLCVDAGTQKGHSILLEVRDSIEAQSFDLFLWDLFCCWEMAGAPVEERWALEALACGVNDDLLYRLAERMMKWKKEQQGRLASMALQVLARNESDAALAILYAFSQTEGSGAPRGAEELFINAAGKRHLSPAKLALKVLPETGLDHGGKRIFTFDSAIIRAGFDETLEPYIENQNGCRLDDFPPSETEKDAELSKAATLWWDKTKQYVTFYGQLQRQLLIEASDFDNYPSVDWKAEGFMIFMAQRNYAPHLVRSSIFARYDSDLPYGYIPTLKCTSVFIIADDGTPINHREMSVTFRPNSVVAIPSPYQTFRGYLGAMKKLFVRLNRNLLFGAFSGKDKK